MRNLIIEQDSRIARGDDFFQMALKSRFTENREVWTDFMNAFCPSNIRETVDRLLALDNGDNLVFEEAITDFQLWDIFVAILYQLKKAGKRLNIYVLHQNLSAVIDRYLAAEKLEEMDRRLQSVIDYHHIYQLGVTEKNDRRVKLPMTEITDNEDGRERVIRMYKQLVTGYEPLMAFC